MTQAERKHFNSLIKKHGETYYGNLRPVADIRFRRKAKLIKKYISQKNPTKILEIGCGTGILSDYLLRLDKKLNIVATDISEEALKIARKKLKKYPKTKVVLSDASKLPFFDNNFDLVMGNGILHHAPLKKTIKETCRVLKKGGKIWFCEPNLINPQIFIEKNLSIIKPLLQDSQDETAFARWRISKKLTKLGLRNVKVTPYEFLHPLLPKAFINYTSKLCIALESVPIIKEFAGTLLITGEK